MNSATKGDVLLCCVILVILIATWSIAIIVQTTRSEEQLIQHIERKCK